MEYPRTFFTDLRMFHTTGVSCPHLPIALCRRNTLISLESERPSLFLKWFNYTVYKYLYCVFKKTIFCIYVINIHGVMYFDLWMRYLEPIKITHFWLHYFILSGSLIVNRVPGFRINDVVSFISGNFDSFRLLRRIALPDSHFSSFRVSLKITWATVTPPKHYELCVITLVRLQ